MPKNSRGRFKRKGRASRTNMDPTPDGLIEALTGTAFYPLRVSDVIHRQTHISHVFLTGDRAYKVKKPVDFGFLDFTTLDKRRHFLGEELRLNRRLCPDVYLEVLPITKGKGGFILGGDGDPVEFVLVMRQMDESRLMNLMFERGRVGMAEVEAVAAKVTPFYKSAATGGEIDDFGRPAGVKVNTDENFEQTRDYIGRAMTGGQFEDIADYTNRFLAERAGLFEARVKGGYVRDGHGDLHMGNIILQDDVYVFDCIEFIDRFRYGDVAVDLGFLAMDLDWHGRPDLGRRLIEVYREGSGDEAIGDVLDFYKCYRACVRGKIHCFTSDGAGTEAEKEEQLDLARKYFVLAQAYTGANVKPRLVVLMGLMGTGKSAVAAGISRRTGWPVLGSDRTRKELAGVEAFKKVHVPFEEGLYGPEMSARVYLELKRRAGLMLAQGRDVIVDGSFKRLGEREAVYDEALARGAKPLFIQIGCRDDVVRARLTARVEGETESDGRLDLYSAQKKDFDGPAGVTGGLTYRLDNSGELDSVIEAALGTVEEA